MPPGIWIDEAAARFESRASSPCMYRLRTRTLDARLTTRLSARLRLAMAGACTTRGRA